jgi:hypothetical protein
MKLNTKNGRAGFTIVEALVVLVIIAVFIGLLLPALQPPVQPPPPQIDKDLDFTSWDPKTESKILLPQDLLTSKEDFTGEWICHSHHLVMDMKLDRPGKWKVSFYAGTRCGLGPSIKLDRIAAYENGILTLDRPVQDISKNTFQRLFAVRIEDRNYLITSFQLNKLKEILEKGDKEERVESLQQEFLTRLDPEKLP